MSKQILLRSVVRPSMAAGSATRPATSSLVQARSFSSSKTSRGAAETSSSGSGSQGAEEDVYTHESFATPFWRNTALLLLVTIGAYRFSQVHADPHPSRASSSGTSAPGNESEDSHHHELQGDNRPFLTRYLENWKNAPSSYSEKAAEYLEWSRRKAEMKMLFQEAERPPVHRLRFPQRLENESPHCRTPGDSVDFSNVIVKRSGE
ncbi:unnamed protein product [Sympodiomycopsis kandeliae]